MFYSEAILSRRGPLAKVWLAAHMERKLSKTQTLQTDIEESVGAIMGQEIEIMALRLSGQLLLGVVRIYSRKAKYLLDDCNEALLKIKMAFRPGIVDMTEEQLAVNRNAITLQENNVDLDLLLPDINWEIDFEERVQQPQGQHVARVADITLDTAADLQFELDDPNYGFDLGPGDGIGSQDFDLDLGIDFGDGPAPAADANKSRTVGEGDDTMSVEVGRDAATLRSPRASLGSHFLGGDHADQDILSNRSKSRELSAHPFGADMDVDFGPDLGGMDIDLGLDFGDGTVGDNSMAQAEAAKSPSRASSRLTTPPPTPPPEDVNRTPRAGEQPEDPELIKKKKAAKKQIIDSVTELKDGPGMNAGRARGADSGSQARDLSDILTEQHFLPRSRTVIRLLEIRRDPIAHFVPTKVTPKGTYFYAGPPGLAPELEELFLRPVLNILSPKRRGVSPEKGANKRARIEKENAAPGEEDVEQARRAGSLAPSVALGSDILRRGSVGPDISGGLDFRVDDSGMAAGMDDYQFDLGPDATGIERALSKSRHSTPAGDGDLLDEGPETYADATCPIAMFDERPSQTQTQTQSQAPEAAAEHDGKGYSKNTVKALTVIRRELQPVPDDAAEKVMSFQEMSHKATRRAAAGFFFELLVLGTRDCVKLSQAGPFENIEIRARDKIWERQRHTPAPRSAGYEAVAVAA